MDATAEFEFLCIRERKGAINGVLEAIDSPFGPLHGKHDLQFAEYGADSILCAR